MSKAIQTKTNRSNPKSFRQGQLSHFIFVLRHGLKKIQEFLGLFPYLKTLFPWRSGTFIKKSVRFRTVAFSAIFVFAILNLAIIFPVSFSANKTDATPSVNDPTITLEVTNPTASVDLSVESVDGTFASSSSSATFLVKTNNFSGYKLSILSNSDNGLLIGKGNTLSSIDNAVSESSFSDAANTIYNGKWGYKPNKLNSSDNSNYLPAPTTDGTILDTVNNPVPSGNNYSISIGARADYNNQVTTYDNVFTVTAISNPLPTFIQDYTTAMCVAEAADAPVTVTDFRDGKTYTVRYINGNCWMTQNLALEPGSTLTPLTSNVSSNYTLPTTQLEGNTLSYGEPQTTCSSNPDYGCYYNYAAASAGTIVGDSSVIEAAYSICPAGWRLPSSTQMQGILQNVEEFSPSMAGLYPGGGSLMVAGEQGYFWTSTKAADVPDYSREALYYDQTNGLRVDTYNGRDWGESIRCIRTAQTIINFNGNGAESGEMGPQRISNGTTANLITSGFTKSGYVVTSWNTEPDGSGTSYPAGGEYAAAEGTEDVDVTLYAQWTKYGGEMQSYSYFSCRANAANEPVILTDARDNKLYSVRYIADNCWMTQNLAYDLTGVTTLTSDTSDVTGTVNFGGEGQPPVPVDSMAYSYTDPYFHIYTESERNGLTAEQLGILYNYAAASAGTIRNDPSTDSSTAPAEQSICPAGWTLPTYAQTQSLVPAGGYNWDTTYEGVFSPVASGYFDDGSLYNVGSYGLFWSSTALSAVNRYYLYYSVGGGLRSGRSLVRVYGLSVRCVQKAPTYAISKSSNINDEGVSTGSYANNSNVTDTVTIPGANSLKVTITYQTESTSYDWVAIYPSDITPSQSNYSSSISGKLGGTTKTTKEFTVSGDTVKIYFKTDGSVNNYYGYYAIIEKAS
ncbi:MAG: FISUMP domain-containing protein [Candidatus Saccharibacteria bacterium]|nr:FISUMP domain-containing protein [Candidatus Saccharibacteria bacterium]